MVKHRQKQKKMTCPSVQVAHVLADIFSTENGTCGINFIGMPSVCSVASYINSPRGSSNHFVSGSRSDFSLLKNFKISYSSDDVDSHGDGADRG